MTHIHRRKTWRRVVVEDSRTWHTIMGRAAYRAMRDQGRLLASSGEVVRPYRKPLSQRAALRAVVYLRTKETR